jgi:hypothetical protein
VSTSPLPFVCEPGSHGTRLTVTGPWSEVIGDYILEHDIRSLELNHAKGWRGHDLSFLRRLSRLESFTIVDFTIEDIAPIHALGALRELDVNTYCKTPLDFSKFPVLEECALQWRPKADSIFERVSLRRLFINTCPVKDLRPFSRLDALERLSLASPKLDTLAGAEALRRLQFLGIYEAKRLAGLADVEHLEHLRALEINGCRHIKDLSRLAPLARLERLLLCDDGEIDTVKPLAGMRDLEEFLFYGSTNVLDGDLSVLKTLPKLRHVVFMDRRHYSHRRTDFPQSAPAAPRPHLH